MPSQSQTRPSRDFVCSIVHGAMSFVNVSLACLRCSLHIYSNCCDLTPYSSNFSPFIFSAIISLVSFINWSWSASSWDSSLPGSTAAGGQMYSPDLCVTVAAYLLIR